MLIEVARALKARPQPPKCNVWLYWIDAEESGAGDWLDYWSMSLIAGSDRLNRILEKHGLYFEWYNAGYAHVYDI